MCRTCFDTHSLLTRSAWDELTKILISREVKKGEVFCTKGSRYNQEFLVERGVVRAYHDTYKHDEVTVSFYTDGQFGTPCFYRNMKGLSTINLQAIEDTLLVEFDAAKFSELMQKHPDLANFGLKIVELELQSRINKEINLLCRPAEERYDEFRMFFPGLENRVPHYYIASYLGITPISLSRIRRKSVHR
jgi:CRP-like cAMP-binding protein